MRFLALILATSCGCGAGAGGPDARPGPPDAGPGVVATESGPVRGARDGETWTWKGIPYARASRWRAPEAPAPWSDPLDAVAYGPPCVQVDPITGGVIGSEDCLTVNVWAPVGAAGLPVLFFVHGGDDIVGCASADPVGSCASTWTGPGTYDGRLLAERGAIVVTAQYRLGAFGFLADPAFIDPHGSTGDYGLWDLLAALQWTQDNIHGFGGDPGRVLLFGQSAGGSNACALVASPLAQDLFARALLMSGPCHTVPDTLVYSTWRAAESALGCDGAADVAACLRAAPAADVARIPGGALGPVRADVDFYVTVDGWLVPEAPETAVATGRGAAVPLVVGTTADEYQVLLDTFLPAPISSEQGYIDLVHEWFGQTIGDQALAVYPASAYASPRDAMVALVGDLYMHCPARRIARAAAETGLPVWRYLYDHTYDSPTLAPYRAAHGFDLYEVFGNTGTYVFSPGERALSDEMAGAWLAFAAGGDPGDAWPAYHAADDNYLVIDVALGTGAGWRSLQCDFWDPYL